MREKKVYMKPVLDSFVIDRDIILVGMSREEPPSSPSEDDRRGDGNPNGVSKATPFRQTTTFPSNPVYGN